jgi:hypothetical protein
MMKRKFRCFECRHTWEIPYEKHISRASRKYDDAQKSLTRFETKLHSIEELPEKIEQPSLASPFRERKGGGKKSKAM